MYLILMFARFIPFLIFSALLNTNVHDVIREKCSAVNSARIKIRFHNITLSDSIFVFLSANEVYDKKIIGKEKQLMRTKATNGYFICDFPLQSAFSYFRIMALRSVADTANHNSRFYDLTDNYYVEPGDDFTVGLFYSEKPNKHRALKNRLMVEEFKLLFDGRGANKCSLKYRADSILATPYKVVSSDIQAEQFTNNDYQIKSIQDSISRLGSIAETLVYRSLRADIHFSAAKSSLGARIAYYRYAQRQSDSLFLYVREQYAELLDRSLNEKSFAGLHEHALCNTQSYIPFIFENIKALAYLKQESSTGGPQRILNTLRFMDLLLGNTKGATRDYLTMYYFKSTSDFEDFRGALEKSISVAEVKEVKKYLEMLMQFAGKERAYNFSLTGLSEEKVQLKDYIGKVIILDFWFTQCSSCANYFSNTLSKVEKALIDNPEVVFISISTDVVKDVWIKSVKSGKYTSPHAVNLYTGGRGTLDETIKAYKVNAYPLPIIIDKKGIIREYATEDLNEPSRFINKIKSFL